MVQKTFSLQETMCFQTRSICNSMSKGITKRYKLIVKNLPQAQRLVWRLFYLVLDMVLDAKLMGCAWVNMFKSHGLQVFHQPGPSFSNACVSTRELVETLVSHSVQAIKCPLSSSLWCSHELRCSGCWKKLSTRFTAMHSKQAGWLDFSAQEKFLNNWKTISSHGFVIESAFHIKCLNHLQNFFHQNLKVQMSPHLFAWS